MNSTLETQSTLQCFAHDKCTKDDAYIDKFYLNKPPFIMLSPYALSLGHKDIHRYNNDTIITIEYNLECFYIFIQYKGEFVMNSHGSYAYSSRNYKKVYSQFRIYYEMFC